MYTCVYIYIYIERMWTGQGRDRYTQKCEIGKRLKIGLYKFRRAHSIENIVLFKSENLGLF